MSNPLPTAGPDDDVFWTACRYVWNELSAEERAAFEVRLAAEESACLAVADAVRLSAGMQSPIGAKNSVRVLDSRSSTGRGRIFALASCCAAAVMAGLVLLNSHDPRPTIPVELASAELVGRWTAGVTDPSIEESVFDEELDFDANADEETLSAPDWLLAAIQLSAGTTEQPTDPRLQDENL